MAEPRSTAGIVARPALLDSLALQAEHNPTRLGRAGAAVVRDAEMYLAFFAELEPRAERTETSVPHCERCGEETPWPVVTCANCKALA